MLRRILGAYARRNAAVGYCQVCRAAAEAQPKCRGWKSRGLGSAATLQLLAAANAGPSSAQFPFAATKQVPRLPNSLRLPLQGLNFLAATLMLWMPEEDAFWCLCAVIEDILGCSYFDERMVLPQVLPGGSWRRGAVAQHPLAAVMGSNPSLDGWQPSCLLALLGHLLPLTLPLPAAGGCARLWPPAPGAVPHAVAPPAGAGGGRRQRDHALVGGLLLGRRLRAVGALPLLTAAASVCCKVASPSCALYLAAKPPPPCLLPTRRFLCCFLNSLPLDSALRVWDLLFFEGSAVVLFRVALALIEIYDQVGRGGFRTGACGAACSCRRTMQSAASHVC